ncbi:hypothetical protein HKD37_17G047707 [Glycine soja]
MTTCHVSIRFQKWRHLRVHAELRSSVGVLIENVKYTSTKLGVSKFLLYLLTHQHSRNLSYHVLRVHDSQHFHILGSKLVSEGPVTYSGPTKRKNSHGRDVSAAHADIIRH